MGGGGVYCIEWGGGGGSWVWVVEDCVMGSLVWVGCDGVGCGCVVGGVEFW